MSSLFIVSVAIRNDSPINSEEKLGLLASVLEKVYNDHAITPPLVGRTSRDDIISLNPNIEEKITTYVNEAGLALRPAGVDLTPIFYGVVSKKSADAHIMGVEDSVVSFGFEAAPLLKSGSGYEIRGGKNDDDSITVSLGYTGIDYSATTSSMFPLILAGIAAFFLFKKR